MHMKGFTLIELLVVIALVSILAVIAFVVFSGVSGRANDIRRKSDVAAIAKAYEARFVNGLYSPLADYQFASGNPPTPPEGGKNFNDFSTTGFRVCAALDGGAQCSVT